MYSKRYGRYVKHCDMCIIHCERLEPPVKPNSLGRSSVQNRIVVWCKRFAFILVIYIIIYLQSIHGYTKQSKCM